MTVLTYVLVVFGAVVRLKGAGLSCPDWPLCYGELVPSMEFGVLFEVGHRYVASAVSLGLVALTGAMWMVDGARERIGKLVVVAWVVLVVQIVLGGLTVLQLLASWTVTSHLLCGNAFALILAVISLRLFDTGSVTERAPASTPLRVAIGATAVLLVAQMALGGLVASNFAGLACVEWPACVGTDWFPTFAGPVGLHVTHRLTAYSLVAAFIAVAWLARGHDRLAHLSVVGLVLVFAQVALGVANVLLRLPAEVSAGHSLVAALLCMTTGLMAYDLFLRGRPTAAVIPVPTQIEEAA
ncbi:MAG: heme A synthase [Proteobacteria bacterium]|nr:heme A synthase [Pseudomonadota bacterium]MCP4917973.1 heme A synthase [Pseudomonadota bacterium]